MTERRNTALPMSPELRARIIADSMGTLPHENRKEAVYRTALEQIRQALAVQAAQMHQKQSVD